MNAFLKVVLKGSLVSAMALVVAAGCSDDSDGDDNSNAGGDGNSGGSSAGTKNDGGSKSDAGETSNGGTNIGGSSGGGGPTDGGAGPNAGGASDGGMGGSAGSDPFAQGGAGGAGYMGPAVAKFCNSLTFGTQEAPMDTTFRLEVGEGDAKVTFTATTGECVPADGEACTEIPTGENVLVQMFDVDNDAEPVDFAGAAITENQQYVFTTDLDNDSLPIWTALEINSGVECSDVTYADLP